MVSSLQMITLDALTSFHLTSRTLIREMIQEISPGLAGVMKQDGERGLWEDARSH